MPDDPALSTTGTLASMLTEISPQTVDMTPRALVEDPNRLAAVSAETRAEALAIVTRDERLAGKTTFDAARFILTEEDARLFLEASLKIGDADYVPFAECVVTRAKLNDAWRG